MIRVFDPREIREEAGEGRRLDKEYAANDAYVNEGTVGDNGHLDIDDLGIMTLERTY